MMKTVVNLIIAGLITGCASQEYIDTRNIRAVGLTHNIANIENAGFVKADDCTWKLFGASLASKPTFNDALENAVSLKKTKFKEAIKSSFDSEARLVKTEIKLLTNIQTRHEAWDAVIIGRECLVLTAIAYR